MASLPRIRRVVIASVPAWATSSRLSSELYAIFTRSVAGNVLIRWCTSQDRPAVRGEGVGGTSIISQVCSR